MPSPPCPEIVGLRKQRDDLCAFIKEAKLTHHGGWLADLAFRSEELAERFEEKDLLEEALEMFSGALTMRQQVYGRAHISNCASYGDTQRVLLKKGDKDGSGSCFDEEAGACVT